MSRGSPPLSDPRSSGAAVDAVDVAAATDPVGAVVEARADGRLLALRTSGTTGDPRAVLRTPESWFCSFGHVAALTGLTAAARLWLPGPLSSTMNLFAAVLARHQGASTVGRAGDATHAHLTPLALERALDAGLLADVHVTVAGDRLSPALRERAAGAGVRVSHYYGSSEQSFVAWGADETDLRPFPGVEVEVRRGEIWVRSPYLCQGYAGPPGAFRTDDRGFGTVGDRGSLVHGVLRVAGRGADAVTTGGATVLVADIEGVLRAATGGEVVVVGLPHGDLGQVVAAALTVPDDLDAVRAAALTSLAPAQRPRLWFRLVDAPTTAAGKVDRVTLAARLAGPGAVRLVPGGRREEEDRR